MNVLSIQILEDCSTQRSVKQPSLDRSWAGDQTSEVDERSPDEYKSGDCSTPTEKGSCPFVVFRIVALGVVGGDPNRV